MSSATGTGTGVHPALQELYEMSPGHRREMQAWVKRWLVEVSGEEAVDQYEKKNMADEFGQHIKIRLLYRLALALHDLVRIDHGTVHRFKDAQQFTARLLVVRDSPSMPRMEVMPPHE